MFSIKHPKENMYLVPVAYDNMMYALSQTVAASSSDQDYPVRFETQRNLEHDYLTQLCAHIEELHCPVCLDMRHISSYVSRGFRFVHERGLPVIFANVSLEAENLRSRLNQDIPGLVIYEHCSEVLCVNVSQVEAIANVPDFQGGVQQLYRDKLCELLRSTLEGGGDDSVTLLESSGVYVNHYIAMKNLFRNMNDAMFVVYQMAEAVCAGCPDWRGKTLVCCSKTGAAFTSLLSMLLGLRAIYCVNIGPKFALDIEYLKREARPGEKYIYAFDFLCMGTEVKILHALLSILDGNLIYGIGVANYLNISAPEFQDSIFAKLHTLVDIREAVPDYRITPVIVERIGGQAHGD